MAARAAPGEIHEHERELAARPIPPVAGDVVEDVLVPARGFLRARHLRAGQVMRIIDVEGEQVPDIILYDPANLKNCSSMTNTMLVAKRWRISTGDTIYAKFGQRMMTIIEDTIGIHAAVGGFCNAELNEVRYGIEGTHSCRTNFVASMRDYGLAVADIEEGCLSAFMNVVYHPDGAMTIEDPTGRAGDYMDLRADMDVIVALSNCPSERNPCNAWNPTHLRVVVYDPAPTSPSHGSG